MNTDFKLHAAMQCAPVILGLKMSNILITHPDNTRQMEELFSSTELDLYCLQRGEERMTWLIYRRNWLEEYLEKENIQEFLKKFGYEDLSLEEKIRHLSQKYEDYFRCPKLFPHELGIFLGYPLADVEGFMTHEGKNYLYVGYWKVYQDVEQAKAVFAAYDMAKKWLCKMAEKGVFVGCKEDLKWIESM